MESITKNRKTQEQLVEMVEMALGTNVEGKIHELNEGYFNAAYEAILKDGHSVVLKIAPRPEITVMSYEKNLMYAEVMAMSLVKENTKVPVAEIYAYVPESSLCESPYFIMEKLSGKLFSDLSGVLEKEKCDAIRKQVGGITQQIASITGEKFGYPGQPAMQGKSWFLVFRDMILLAISDAQKRSIDLKVDTCKLLSQLEGEESCFEEVSVPRLVHWDLWDGNVMVEGSTVTGIIDFERALWGDPLMEVGFRSYGQEKSFLEGYGKTEFTPNEKKRIRWYDIYLFLLVALEYKYRAYETDDTYQWATEMLKREI